MKSLPFECTLKKDVWIVVPFYSKTWLYWSQRNQLCYIRNSLIYPYNEFVIITTANTIYMFSFTRLQFCFLLRLRMQHILSIPLIFGLWTGEVMWKYNGWSKRVDLMSLYASRFSLALYCIKRCIKIFLSKIQIQNKILIKISWTLNKILMFISWYIRDIAASWM